jgi:acetyl/propionyl-CoA carboxylase alpha subunit
LYAEDPEHQFLPSTGRLQVFSPPVLPWCRLDTGVEQGSEITSLFDPMLAKISVWGESRQNAIQRMTQALSQCVVLGIKTNLPLLIQIMKHPDFVNGETQTSFINKAKLTNTPSTNLSEAGHFAAMALSGCLSGAVSHSQGQLGPEPGPAAAQKHLRNHQWQTGWRQGPS